MGDAIGRALAKQGERVRVYVPFGELLPGMAYLVRRLLENSSNDSFIRKAGGNVDAAHAPRPAARKARPKARNRPSMRTRKQTFHNEPEVDFAL